jgi:hypothetical protein
MKVGELVKRLGEVRQDLNVHVALTRYGKRTKCAGSIDVEDAPGSVNLEKVVVVRPEGG